MAGAKVKLGTPDLKANLTDEKTITLTWDTIPDVETYEVDDVGDLTKNYDSSTPTTAIFTKTDPIADGTEYTFFVTAKPAATSPDKEDSDKGTTNLKVDVSTLASASSGSSGSSASSANPLATVSAAGGKTGVKMQLNVVANMEEDGAFKDLTIEESTVNGEPLKKDPSKEDMKTILDKMSASAKGGARKSRKSRKAKRTKKGGKKRRSTKRSR
jgi:hypothetical protein